MDYINRYYKLSKFGIFCLLLVSMISISVNNASEYENGVCDRKRIVVIKNKTEIITKYTHINMTRYCKPHNDICIQNYRIIVRSPINMTYSETEFQDVCCPGYEYDEINKKCISTCNPFCINAHCVENNECKCIQYYYKTNESSHECQACTCINGFCNIDGRCDDCKYDYMVDPTNPRNCLKCGSDICVNGYCDNKNKCLCNKGYILDKNNLYNCIPDCNPECRNGICVAPNRCQCNEGYIKHENMTYNCIPKCKNGCTENSDCVSPNKCECRNGYQRDERHNCIPICKNNCTNGWCISPGKCICDDGFKLNFNKECKPICDNLCTNGKCVMPNKCECIKGYKNINNKCHPDCSDDCVNGTCTRPNYCTCKHGYKKSTKSKFICEPRCSKPCINGTCIEPNTCRCNTGFYKEPSTHKCVPNCRKKCINSDCVGHELCVCHINHTKNVIDPYKCDPVCSSACINGYCSSPDTCTCYDGYILSDGKCKSECNNCTNGYCDDANKCICNKGYVLDYEFTCVPELAVLSTNDTFNAGFNNICWNIVFGSIGLAIVCIVIMLVVLLSKYCKQQPEQNSSSWKFIREFRGYGNVRVRSIQNPTYDSVYRESNYSVEAVSITEEEDRRDFGPGHFFQNPSYLKKMSPIYENSYIEEDQDIFFNPVYESLPTKIECDENDEGDYANIK